MLTDAHYDPRAAADFFSRMQRGTQLHDSPAAQYRRTHPLTIERMSDMQTRVRELAQHPSRATPDNTTFELIRARLRVLQANTDSGARDAIAHFSARLQEPSASTRAAAHYGMAVAQLRLGQNQEALASAKQAKALTPTTIPMLEKAVIEARFLSGDRTGALEQAQSHAARFPLSRLSALLYAQLLQRHGDHPATLAFMRSQLALTKTQVKYHEIIARSYAALGQNTRAHQATAEAYALMGATPAAIEQLKLAQKAADADFYVLSEIDARLRQLSAQLRDPPSKPLE
ncbi:MAG TPA: hypothetical protein PLQ67_04295 [Burkholderiaceae bacterium]|nr:hypothetical protein [Burkholderiaceae bacterium]